MTAKLVNFVLFQLVWLACVGGAARGLTWPGLLAGAVLLPWNLRLVPDARRELVLWLQIALVGSLADSLLTAAGLIGFTVPSALSPSLLVPGWIVVLWLAFASLLRRSLAWLAAHRWLAVLLGAVGGPLSFATGVRMGAVTLGPDPALSIAALSVEWALLTPLLLAWAHRETASCVAEAHPAP